MYKYALLILICLGVTAMVAILYGIKLRFSKIFGLTFLVGFGLMLVFNTYLTGLPIVVYNINSILGFRILTFPVEDIGYLIAVVILLPPLYKKLSYENNQHSRGKQKITKSKL